MKELFKKKVTREQFLKAGLGVLAGVLAGTLVGSRLTKVKTNSANNAYGSGVYGG